MKNTFALCAGFCLISASAARAYVEIPYTLGRAVQESTNIVLLEVTKVNKDRRLIYYKKIKDIKGTHPTEEIKHQIKDGFNPREPKFIMEWAEVGKKAVMMYQGGASETCIDGYWYQAYAQGEWWAMSHAEPFFQWVYNSESLKLAAAVETLLAGKEVVVVAAQFDAAKVDECKKLMHERKSPVWRMRASLALQDYNAMMADRAKYIVGMGPGGGPPAVRLFGDEAKFVFSLTDGTGKADLEVADPYKGPAALRITGKDKGAAAVPDWFFGIAEKPEAGDYRFIRFAWKKRGGGSPTLMLSDGSGFARSYYAGGEKPEGDKAVKVADAAPGEWVVVTRDLYADFGGAFLLTGIRLGNLGGQAALFDEILLGRTIEDLDKLSPR